MNGNAQIFVANLSPAVTEEDLRRVFGAHGTVMEASLVTDRVSGEPRGFAFVTMFSSAQAQTAMNGLNGTDLAGCALALNLAKPRLESRASGRRRHASGYNRNPRGRHTTVKRSFLP